MDQEPPVRRNIFLIAVVVLFNLIWLTLLFMSCQADETQQSDVTPTVQTLYQHNPNISTDVDDALKQVGEEAPDLLSVSAMVRAEIVDYRVPRYRPPST